MSGKRYTDEFKIEAVKQVTERGHSVADVAQRLGITTHSLYAWRAKFDKPDADVVRQAELDQNAEVRRLKAELKRVTEERDILYLPVVLDPFNREVVGWSIKPRMTTDLVADALTMAWFRRRPAPGALCHSDRGSQYASYEFQRKLAAYGMRCSMSRKGNCWDNAPTESFFNSLKNERVHATRYRTHQDAKADLFEYIEVFYNRSRRHSSLSLVSPEQILQDWIKSQQTKDAAA